MHFRQTFSLLFFLSHKILSYIFPQTLCLSHQLITQKEYNSFALVLSLSLSHSPKRLSVPLHVRTIWLPSSTHTLSLFSVRNFDPSVEVFPQPKLCGCSVILSLIVTGWMAGEFIQKSAKTGENFQSAFTLSAELFAGKWNETFTLPEFLPLE